MRERERQTRIPLTERGRKENEDGRQLESTFNVTSAFTSHCSHLSSLEALGLVISLRTLTGISFSEVREKKDAFLHLLSSLPVISQFIFLTSC